MSARVVGLVLLALAAVVYLAGAARFDSQAAAASDEYRQARDRRREARARLAELERRAAARARAAAVLAAARSAPSGVREIRRGVVDLVTRSRVSAVRLGVRPGRPPAAATVALSAEGSFADVLHLTGEMARAGSGLVLERVRLVSHAPRVGLDLEASGLAGGS